MNEEHILKWLDLIGFYLENGSKNAYFRNFDDGKIIVNIEARKIIYPDSIKIHRNTTTNLSNEENLVVLECVCRLLEKGYNFKDIELEKSWSLGHKSKGFLDILVNDKQGNSLFMIECKTWGTEFNKEKNKMFKDGGQLLSYFRQDRKPKALCLYASVIKNGKLDFTNEIIDTENLKGENETEIFDSWSKSFITNGIFEPHVSSYEFKSIGLTYNNLKDLEVADGKTIFNQFAEILRRHVVSDKTNAFNKIFNLFICKIKDEDLKKDTDEELKFQFKKGETDEQLIDKLKELYKTGLEDYIKIIVPYISRSDLSGKLSEETINEILYYRESQEFSFKDVYNKETFKENAEIVKEVVELLQKYKIKYSGKHQHLGDFFELLLNTGIKQESGQFFTPIPISRFICKSLPIEQIINKKNSDKEIYFLPHVIDYASGSGHFITEIMDEIDGYVKTFNEKDIKGGDRALKEFRKNKDYIAWAKEYVYAIEKDYRLVKISKIASFLNGDGDANVISGDGLAPFNSKKYLGALQVEEGKKDNKNFDVLVANPPYSVSGFKKNFLKEYEVLKLEPEKYFELYESLTDSSSEIECLFIERAKQLLKEGGVCGIILPISILTNGGIYEKTREIIFKNFYIRSIVSLGSGAFMATGTKTIIMFLEKRAAHDFEETAKEVEKFLKGGFVDVTVNGIKDAFSVYIRNIYEKLSFEEYKKVLSGTAVENELAKEYKGLNLEQIKHLEREKLIYFFLSFPQKIVLADSGEKDVEKEFYGFEFSNRRGHEGIHIYKTEEGLLNSKLYDETDLNNKEKLNGYILKAFLGDKNLESEITEIQASESHPLKEHIHYLRLSSLLTFDLKRFDKSINLNKRNNLKIETKWDLVNLGELSTIVNGITYDKRENISKSETNIKILTADNISFDDKLILNIEKAIYLKNATNVKIEAKLNKGDILFCSSSGSKAHVGKSCYIEEDLSAFAGGFMSIIRGSSNINRKYLLYIFNLMRNLGIFANLSNGNNINNLSSQLQELSIPLPPMEVQEKIVKEISKIEEKELKAKEIIQKNEVKIKSFFGTGDLVKIDEIGEVKSGGTPSTNISEYWTPEIYWATIVDVKEKYLHKTKRKISKVGLQNSGATLLPINSILFSSRATIGEVSIAKVETTTNQGFKNLICNPKIANYEYVYHILKIKGQELKNSFGRTTYGEINTSQFKEIKIHLPSLLEQERIIAEVMPLEKEIEEQKEFLSNVSLYKKEILDKYLM